MNKPKTIRRQLFQQIPSSFHVNRRSFYGNISRPLFRPLLTYKTDPHIIPKSKSKDKMLVDYDINGKNKVAAAKKNE
jgi:hypothetical protein